MKLRNKKTGEIIEFKAVKFGDKVDDEIVINVDDWEIYVEPNEFYIVDLDGEILVSDFEDKTIEKCKMLGNYFETKEEAEKAVEKLKAWKRLKDKGFKLDGWTIDDSLRISICTNTDEDDLYDEDRRRMKADLDLLFGGEE